MALSGKEPLWSTLSEESKTASWKDIARRWDQLVDEQQEWRERITKYLFLINSGGAVSVLTFIGSSAEVRGMVTPYLALGAFCIGVVLVGYFNAASHAQVANLLSEWQRGTVAVVQDKITVGQLRAADFIRVVEGNKLPENLAKAAFAFFHFGLLLGLLGLVSDWSLVILKAICPE